MPTRPMQSLQMSNLEGRERGPNVGCSKCQKPECFSDPCAQSQTRAVEPEDRVVLCRFWKIRFTRKR